MSESFKPMPGNEQLFVPAHVADESHQQYMAKHEGNVGHQEMLAQNEVLGSDGLGSIRQDSEGVDGRITDNRAAGSEVASPFVQAKTPEQAAQPQPESKRRGKHPAAPTPDAAGTTPEPRKKTSSPNDGSGKPSPRTHRSAARPQTTMPYDPMLTVPQHAAPKASEGTGGATRFDPDKDNDPTGANSAAETSGSGATSLDQITDLTSPEELERKALLGRLDLAVQELSMTRLAAHLGKLDQSKPDQKAEYDKLTDDLINTMSAYAETHHLNQEQQDILLAKVVGAFDRKSEQLTQNGSDNELRNLSAGLEGLRDRYAEETAKRRRGYRADSKALKAAREAYENGINETHEDYAIRLAEAGYSPEEIKAQLAVVLAIDEAKALEERIYKTREQLANNSKLKFFYNKWASWGGRTEDGKFNKSGFVKKAAAMAGIGFAAGTFFGLFAVATGVGAVAGGVAGLAAGRGVARSLAGAKLNKGAAETVALAQSTKHLSESEVHILERDFTDKSEITGGDITRTVESKTKQETRRNTKRLIGSAALGAVGGALGAVAGHGIHDFIEHRFSSPGIETPGPDSGKVTPGGVVKPGTEQLQPQGKGFNVEYGSGEIREIQEYAASRGHQLTGEQATQLYEKIHDQFGRKIVDLDGTSHDTYLYKGDVRLSQPGSAHWFPGVEQAILDQLKDIDDAA